VFNVLPNPVGPGVEKDPHEELVYWATSDSGHPPYRIDMSENGGVGLCACPQSFIKGAFCKHLARTHIAQNIANNQKIIKNREKAQ
jgi:hypothetical protein